MVFAVNASIMAFKIYSGKKSAIVMEVTNTIFEAAEFMAFYVFFKHCIQSTRFKNLLTTFLICIFFVIGVYFTALTFPNYPRNLIEKHSLFINVLEFFFLGTMCLAYFYELLTRTPQMTLAKRPSFLITTSTFFYSVLLIPFFAIAQEAFTNGSRFYNVLFACHFVLLGILLLTILKAFLRRKPITT